MNTKEETNKTITEALSDWIRGVFSEQFGADIDLSGVGVVQAANPQFGDYQCNAAMSLAKVLKRPPRAVSEQVVANAPSHPAVDRLEIAGPGFINIYLSDAWLLQTVSAIDQDSQLGVPRSGAGHTVVVDYSSPNVAKPMHIGHIRSTIIGNSIDRLHRLLGYNVIADNHIGDWGTQFGIIMMGYRHFLDKDALARRPVEELERVYVKSYEKSREDENWLTQCREELVKLQSGDPENTALWREFIGLSLSEFDRIYKRLGVSFDLVRGESFYNDKLADTVALLEEKGMAEESEGATVVFLEEEKLPVCIVKKSDGGFNYATTDIATVASRVEEFRPDKIVYVTDERQQLHFKQFFTICRKLGCETELNHVWFGLMRLPEATFSTRQGNVIKLEALLDEAEQRAFDIVSASSPEMSEDDQREVARAVGIGAVKYADLSQNPQTTVTFTWDKALALDGNSGPYLQYAYARIASVHDKYTERFPDGNLDAFDIVLTEPIERELALKLIRFPDVVKRAASGYKPSTIADYLYELAQCYSSFYQNVPFLKAEEGIRESRVKLCGITAQVLRGGLQLLGIETPARI
ncbi:MAG: arginine--tRNA ligase [Verrucomicrobia bacterium]|jgi:arginyl-tRNA synthetase|nr:arginine--tRNA ligase [Verrucomicrobiota bacterium]